MQDNVLKKEFSQRDVKRIRNIVTKKYGEATNTQIGYTKSIVDHNEGDIWEENNKKWTIRNGIKQNITKLHSFKKLVHIPLLCPSCSKPLKTDYDKKMYKIHNICLECTVTYETQLKINGTYEEYSNNIIKSNLEFYLNDYEDILNDLEKSTDNNFISEQGIIETWLGDNKKIVENMRNQLKNVKNNVNH